MGGRRGCWAGLLGVCWKRVLGEVDIFVDVLIKGWDDFDVVVTGD